MSNGLGKSVAIIGAGAYGLVSLKSLLEGGFEAVAYERNDHIGGLWHVSNDTTQTTALSGTISNISKYIGCYSDFPLSDDTSLHPTAKEVQKYLEAYATHFKLWPNLKLARSVVKIERDEDRRKWIITASSRDGDTQIMVVDRLVLATGANNKPVSVRLRNAEIFKGEIIHSQQFKDPSKYAGRTVIVVGAGQTAADTVEFLRLAGAKKLYMSHRRTFMLLPRMLAGKPMETVVTRRSLVDGARDRARDVSAADDAAERTLESLRGLVWPDLNDNPSFASSREKPLMHASLPVICDSIAQNLISGAVESVQAIDRVTGARSVALKDGTEIHDIDAIIQCSGSSFDFSCLLPAEFDPTNHALAPKQFDTLRSREYYRDDLTVCRAYRHFISLQEPHSLAFLGHVVSKTTLGLFPFYDLISMALAQLWKGAVPMPSKADMERDCDEHLSQLAGMLNRGEVSHTALVYELEYDNWLHETAGTGVPARLAGGGCKEEQLWESDRKLYSMLMDGVYSPLAMRLFQTGKRKAWDGAQPAIEKANREVDDAAVEWKHA